MPRVNAISKQPKVNFVRQVRLVIALVHSAWCETLIAIYCMMRNSPLLLKSNPQTPLRVLCIVAFDTLRMIRTGKSLSASQIRRLAIALDFGAWVNAIVDQKTEPERRFFKLSETKCITRILREYRERLHELERNRPVKNTDAFTSANVKKYRESVVLLSLDMCFAVVEGKSDLDEGSLATNTDLGFMLMFRMAMLCQIIDDLWDAASDRAAGLPSFLTVSTSTATLRSLVNAYDYTAGRHKDNELRPLRLALWGLSVLTHIFIRVTAWRGLR